MPSGKTHDLLTVALLVPTFVAARLATGDAKLALVVTFFTLFGGFMFGPDLDTHSREYTRWGVFRFLWLPYKVIFAHRSRWSHGLLFGTLIRVLYFAGVIGALVAAGVYLRAFVVTSGAPAPGAVWREWQTIYDTLAQHAGGRVLGFATFAGLWWGAAIHTIADFGWSTLRRGKGMF